MIGTVDVLRDVAPVSEAPQHGTGVNEAGGRGDATGGAVGTDDDIGDESTAIVELDGRVAHVGHPARDRFGTGGDGGVADPRIEAQPGDGQAVVGIGPSGPGRQEHPAPGRADHDHRPDVPAGRRRQTERCQQRQRPGPDKVAARLVPAEGRLVDQGHPCTAAGQHQGRRAAGRSRADHDGVMGCLRHGTSREMVRMDSSPLEGRRDACLPSVGPHRRRSLRSLFAGLPNRYDRLAAVLSLGQDRRWRREMIDHALTAQPAMVLDVATGPAGVALALAERGDAHGSSAST